MPTEASTNEVLSEADCKQMLLASIEGDPDTAIQFRNSLRKLLKKQRRANGEDAML